MEPATREHLVATAARGSLLRGTDFAGGTLYPYVVCDLTIYQWERAHAEALAALVAGHPHPRRDQLLEWHRLATEYLTIDATLIGDEPTYVDERVFGDLAPLAIPRVEQAVVRVRRIHEIRLALAAEELAKLDQPPTENTNG